jgi:Mrp family chromosome partitioning ATPase
MKIAIASGKGGTGKTTVATNLAYVASQDGSTVAYLDCDVEISQGAAARAIRQIWLEVQDRLRASEPPMVGNLVQLSSPWTNILMSSRSRR